MRVLVLDLDGTLVDSVPDLLVSLNIVLQARSMATIDRAEVTGMIGDGAQVLLQRVFKARGAVPGADALDEFLTHYTAHAADLSQPFPGAIETLRGMRAEGWRFAVCTNKPEAAARALLDALDLSPLLQAVGGGDSFPTRKPDPAHLLATLRAAGGTPAGAVMVGDHDNDVQAAAGAGLPCIFAGWGYGPLEMAGSNPVAQHFSDLPHICEALLPRA